MTYETTTTTATTQGPPIEAGCLDKRNVITTDGRIIGELTGVYIDPTTWTVTGLILDVNKDVMNELNMKKPILRTPKAMIQTSLVSVMSDTVQLSVPTANLAGNLTVVQ